MGDYKHYIGPIESDFICCMLLLLLSASFSQHAGRCDQGSFNAWVTMIVIYGGGPHHIDGASGPM